MTYQFINNASLEPDLKDAIIFINKPLNIIHELQNKLEKFSIGEKTNTYNLEVSLKIDKILSYYLPNLFNNYTKLSLEYRNKKIIKSIKNKQLTAKDILLNDLAKITEEISIIEKEFNDTNKIHLLANNRIISNLGYQQSFLTKENKSIQYENEFNYDEFIKNNDVIFNKKEIDNETEDDFFDNIITEEKNGPSLIEILMVFGVITIIMLGTFNLFKEARASLRYEGDITNILKINEDIKSLYVNKSDYKGLKNQILISLNIIPLEYIVDKNSITTYSGWKMTYKEKDNNYLVTINDLNKKACLNLVNSLKNEYNINNQTCSLDSNNLTLQSKN